MEIGVVSYVKFYAAGYVIAAYVATAILGKLHVRGVASRGGLRKSIRDTHFKKFVGDSYVLSAVWGSRERLCYVAASFFKRMKLFSARVHRIRRHLVPDPSESSVTFR